MRPLSPLILECARPAPDPSHLTQLSARVLDWEAIIAQAEYHGLVPLLHWCLQSEAIADAVAQRICGRFTRNAHRNLRFGGELLRITTLFQAAGIEVLALKGPTIAWSLYETPALREMCDLDLLVHPAEARRAYDLLLSDGYEPTYPGADWRLFRWLSEISLVRGDVPVDLHWAALPRYLHSAAPGEDAWTRSHIVPILGGVVRTFCPEDLLLFLAVHGGKHCWISLNWIADLARLAARPALDWDSVLARSQSKRISRTLSVALILLRDLLRCELPPEVNSFAARDAIALTLARQVDRGLHEGIDWAKTGAQRLRFAASLAESGSVRALAYLNEIQPTLADHSALGLPHLLFPLYYVARPVRLIAKYGLGNHA